MGYLRRGLTLTQLRKQGRELAKNGGTPRELALLVAEDNYSIHIIATNGNRVLSERSRNEIRKWARSLSDEDLDTYNHYIRLSYNIFNLLLPDIERNYLGVSRNATIIKADLRQITETEKYCTLYNHFLSVQKEIEAATPPPGWADGKDYLKGIFQDLHEMREAIGSCFFRDRTDGTIEPIYERLYAMLSYDSARLRFSLTELLTYKIVIERLCEEGVEDFIPDYMFYRFTIAEEPFYNAEYSKYSEEHSVKQEAKIKELRAQLREDEENSSLKDLIRKEEELYLDMRRYSVIPEPDITRQRVKENRVAAILKNVLDTSKKIGQ